MTHNEFEQSKNRLEETRRAGLAAVEAGYQAQMRALEMVWMLQAGLGESSLSSTAVAATAPAVQAPPPLPPPAPARPRSWRAGEVDDDVRANLPRLPESFTRGDVCKQLGYEPDRGALYRCLETLTREGLLRVESKGSGRRATVYCRTGGEASPA
jgi:hypothetical protein